MTMKFCLTSSERRFSTATLPHHLKKSWNSWALSLVAAFLVPGPSAQAASWYVDNAATGANNGTSWANAWNNPTNVVWASVNPGDTVFVSGGTTSKIYRNALIIGKNGTAGNYITVKIGQDAGHNGVAIFDGVALSMNSSAQWNAIDGSRDPAFVAPTNHQQVIRGATAITNNIGFWVRDLRGGLDSDTSPVLWYFTGSSYNLRFSYIQVTGLSNTFAFNGGSTAGYDWRGTVAYFNGNSSSDMCSNVVFEYLYFATNCSQQFAASAYPSNNFDAVVVKFCYIFNGGEDHFETGTGWTIRDSVIGPFNGFSKTHADFFQFTASKIKVYNNDIRESGNSVFRLQNYPGFNSHDIYIFNNLVTEKVGRAVNGGTFNEPFTVVPEGTVGATATMSNIIIANNLFFNTVSNYDGGTRQLCNNPFVSFSNDKATISNMFLKGIKFVNNITIDKHKGLNLPNPSQFQAFTTNDVWYDYNTQWATNTLLEAPLRVNYMGVAMTNGSGAYAFHNTTNAPAFTDVANDNFELLSSDTAAKNTGYNLSAYFNFDALNRPRNVGGAWDRGPLERPQPATTPPGAFNLVGPASGSITPSVTPLLSWDASTTAGSYTIEISADSSFTLPLVQVASTSGLSYSVPSGVLLSGGTYYWRVRATNEAGASMAANGPFSFFTPNSGGADEGLTNGLLTWLTFDDDFSDGRLDDASGNGNHAWRFGRPGSVYPTNFPVRVAATMTPGVNTNGVYCGDFRWWTNTDYGIYLKDGQYAAITNVPAFTNLSQMTVVVWARYSPASRLYPGWDYSHDGNATLISAGTSAGTLGAWDMGRMNSLSIWLNNTRFAITTNGNFGVSQVGNVYDPVYGKAGKAVFNFPDNGYNNDGDSAQWHHYAMTFNAGVVKTYYDGTNLVTSDLSGSINHLTVGMNGSVPISKGFIGIGCDTHAGTPALDTGEPGGVDYPNHGWFNGQMDDIRIYNRALSDSEIGWVYSSVQPIRPDPPRNLSVLAQ
jgi:hypothetical protein